MNPIPHLKPSELDRMALDRLRGLEQQYEDEARNQKIIMLDASERLSRLTEELSKIKKSIGPRMLLEAAGA